MLPNAYSRPRYDSSLAGASDGPLQTLGLVGHFMIQTGPLYGSSDTDCCGGDVKERYVNASEIGTYVYCAKSWQLSQIGAPSQNTSEQGEGTEWHAAHSEHVPGAECSAWLARVFAFVLVILLLALAFRSFVS